MTELVAIYAFDRMELLDFAGPFAVFSTASRLKAREKPETTALFEVITIAESMDPVRSRGGLILQPHFFNIQPPGYRLTRHPRWQHHRGVREKECDRLDS